MKKWTKTPTANLYRYEATGGYYMRAKIFGEDVKRSLKTKSMEIAKTKLRTTHEKESARIAAAQRLGGGPGTVGKLIDAFRKMDSESPDLKQRTKDHHEDYIKCIETTWSDLRETQAGKLLEEDCKAWALRVKKKYSAPHYNGCIEILRAILKQAVECGIRLDNPAGKLPRATVKQKELHLPSQDGFTRILHHLDAIEERANAAKVIRFLAYTGTRTNEAAQIEPDMIDWHRNELRLPGRITKNGQERRVPIIDELRPVLTQLLTEYKLKDGGAKGPLLPIRDPSKSLETCCKLAGVKKITNHDLRHLFATRCIESGVDIKTIAQWLGHLDGGALLLKTYAHLRNEHSQSMAKLVRFTPEPDAKTVTIPTTANV